LHPHHVFVGLEKGEGGGLFGGFVGYDAGLSGVYGGGGGCSLHGCVESC
jgi:hypothetical protein